mgnify:CR=1 FL=1
MKQQRRFAEKQLVIATHNKGKLREITALFDGFDFTVIAADSLGLAEPEETETSFRGNALLKARAAAVISNEKFCYYLMTSRRRHNCYYFNAIFSFFLFIAKLFKIFVASIFIDTYADAK